MSKHNNHSGILDIIFAFIISYILLRFNLMPKQIKTALLVAAAIAFLVFVSLAEFGGQPIALQISAFISVGLLAVCFVDSVLGALYELGKYLFGSNKSDIKSISSESVTQIHLHHDNDSTTAPAWGNATAHHNQAVSGVNARGSAEQPFVENTNPDQGNKPANNG